MIAALNNMDRELAQLDALVEINPDTVLVVNVDEVIVGNNVVALNNALSDADLTLIQDAISADPTLAQALTAAGVIVEDVVAVSVLPTGQIIIYYQLPA